MKVTKRVSFVILSFVLILSSFLLYIPCAKAEGELPAQVKNVRAEEIDSCAVLLTWDTVEGATSYMIPRGMDPAVTTNSNSAWVHGLSANEPSEFQVIAVNDYGEGIPSETFTVNTLSLPPVPSKVPYVEILNTTSGEIYSSATIRYEQSTDALRHYILYSTSPDMSEPGCIYVSSFSAHICEVELGVFSPETVYYLQVVGENFDAEDNFWATPSDIVQFTTPAPMYAPPEDTTVLLRDEYFDSGADWITVSWAHNASNEWGNISMFRLYYAESTAQLGDDCQYVDIAVSGWCRKTYTLENLNPSTTYYFQVLPYNSLGVGTLSEIKSITTTGNETSVNKLTVSTGEITGCSVGIVQNGSWVYSPIAIEGNEVSFNVLDTNTEYQVRVSKGGMSIYLYGQAGDTVTVPVETLTVNTGAISGCSVGIVQNGAWVYTASAVSGNQATFNVFDNGKDYEVRVSKGGMSSYLYGQAGDTVTVPVETLTVNTGAISGCSVGIVQNGAWVYTASAVTGNQATFNVFDNGKDYEIRVSKGGMSIYLYGRAGDTVTVPVKTLTVNTGAISSCSVGIVQNGAWVYTSSAVTGNQATFNVFDNGKDYQVRVSKGGMSIYLYGKAGDTVTVPVETLTVNTGAISNCAVGIVQNGAWVYASSAVTGNQATFNVFDNGKDYEARIAKGGMGIYLYGQAGSTLAAPTYAVSIPEGLTNVGLVQNGSWVYQNISSPGLVHVFRNNKAAELRYMIGGLSRRITFALDGTEDISALIS